MGTVILCIATAGTDDNHLPVKDRGPDDYVHVTRLGDQDRIFEDSYHDWLKQHPSLDRELRFYGVATHKDLEWMIRKAKNMGIEIQNHATPGKSLDWLLVAKGIPNVNKNNEGLVR